MNTFLIIFSLFFANKIWAQAKLSCEDYLNVLEQNFEKRKHNPLYKKNEEVIGLKADLEILSGLKKIKGYVDNELFSQFREKNGESLDHITESLQNEIKNQKAIFDIDAGCKIEVAQGSDCPHLHKKYDPTLNPVTSFAQNYQAKGFFDTLFDNEEDIFKQFSEYLITKCSYNQSDRKELQLKDKIRKSFFPDLTNDDCKNNLDKNRLNSQKSFILSLFKLAKSGTEGLEEKQIGYLEELESVQNSINYYQMSVKGLKQKFSKIKGGFNSNEYLKQLSEITRAAKVNLNANIDLNEKATIRFNNVMKQLDPLWPGDEDTQYRYLNYKWNFGNGSDADNNKAYLGKVGALFSEMVYGFHQYKHWQEEDLPFEMGKLLKDLSPNDYQKCNTLALKDIETNFNRKHINFISKIFTCVGAISPNGLEEKIKSTISALKKSEAELKKLTDSALDEDYRNLEYLGEQIVELIKASGCEQEFKDDFKMAMPCLAYDNYKTYSVKMLFNDQKKIIRFIKPSLKVGIEVIEVEKSNELENSKINALIDDLTLSNKLKTALKLKMH
ncbi:MAG: hypothetical protein U0T83_03435 [Bacteriovoracaceae bacterium]